MSLQSLLDCYECDEPTKKELTRAYKNYLKFRWILFFMLTLVALPLAYWAFVIGMGFLAGAFAWIFVLIFGIFPPFVLSLLIANFSENLFLRNLKFTSLSEPTHKVELRRK